MIFKRFIAFLKSHDALEDYLNTSSKCSDYPYRLRNIYMYHPQHLSSSFDWAETEKGYSFWFNIHKEWFCKLKNDRFFIIVNAML